MTVQSGRANAFFNTADSWEGGRERSLSRGGDGQKGSKKTGGSKAKKVGSHTLARRFFVLFLPARGVPTLPTLPRQAMPPTRRSRRVLVAGAAVSAAYVSWCAPETKHEGSGKSKNKRSLSTLSPTSTPHFSRYYLKACATPDLILDDESDVGRVVLEK